MVSNVWHPTTHSILVDSAQLSTGTVNYMERLRLALGLVGTVPTGSVRIKRAFTVSNNFVMKL